MNREHKVVRVHEKFLVRVHEGFDRGLARAGHVLCGLEPRVKGVGVEVDPVPKLLRTEVHEQWDDPNAILLAEVDREVSRGVGNNVDWHY